MLGRDRCELQMSDAEFSDARRLVRLVETLPGAAGGSSANARRRH